MTSDGSRTSVHVITLLEVSHHHAIAYCSCGHRVMSFSRTDAPALVRRTHEDHANGAMR